MNFPGISISPQGAGFSLIFEFQSLTDVLPEILKMVKRRGFFCYILPRKYIS
jgi:hypothetical protein